MKTIAVLGIFDTKGVEHAFVAEQIAPRGHRALMVKVGGQGEAQGKADISCVKPEYEINDPAFAQACARELLANIERAKTHRR